MALARTYSVSVVGVSGQLVEVEADLSAGLPGLTFTGLADASVLESRERIRTAVLNSGFAWPNRRITVALLPADLRKHGSMFDLALAVAVLSAAGEVPALALADTVWLGELGLDGRLRSVRGVLPAVLARARTRHRHRAGTGRQRQRSLAGRWHHGVVGVRPARGGKRPAPGRGAVAGCGPLGAG